MDDQANAGEPLAPPILPPASVPPLIPAPWGFWATIGWSAVILCCWIAAQGVGMFISMACMGMLTLKHLQDVTALETNGAILFTSASAGAPVSVALSLLFAKLKRGISLRQYFAWRWPKFKTFAVWFGGFLAYLVLSDVITNLIGRPIVPDSMLETYRHPGSVFLMVFALLIAAPFGEEFLFRGFMFPGLMRSRVGVAGATLITSFGWAVLHAQYDWYGMAMIFFTGIYFSLARWRTNSLPICIALHFTMNFGATLEVFYFLHKNSG